jgi:PKD domain
MTRRLAPAFLAALALAASAGGAPTPRAGSWLAPVALSPPNRNADDALVGTDGAGDTVVLWVDGDASGQRLLARFRPAGGRFTPPQRLAKGESIAAPRLAVNARGDAVALWVLAANGVGHLQAAFRRAGGRFGSVQDVAAPSAKKDYATEGLGIDGRGNATALWTANTLGASDLVAARRPDGRHFGEPQSLGSAGSAALAVSADGEAIAGWLSGSSFMRVVRTAIAPTAAAPFGSAQNVSGAGDTPCCVTLAANARGDAAVAWPVYGRGSAVSLHAAVRSAGRPFGPEEIVPGLASAGSPSLAVDARGGVTIAWFVDDFVLFPLDATYRPPDGTFAPPRELSPDAGYVSLASNRSSTMIAWSRFAGDYVVRAASLNAGVPGPVHNLSERGYNAIGTAVGVDDGGDAVAVWLRSNGGTFLVQEAAYDGAGPRLAALSVPTQARVGESLRLSVSPLDVWSRVAATRWSFGDGGRALGRRVDHAYGRAGRYVVSVTSTDALGHQTTAARTIVVTRTGG